MGETKKQNMKAKTKWIVSLSLAASTVLGLVGCGGGGATSPINPATGNQVSLYVTDDVSTTYDHIWVTIKKVTLTSASGVVTVYDNPTGQQLDLTQLHDNVGSVFAFLGTGSIPPGTYTAASFTLGKDVTVVAKGGTTTTTKTFKNLDSSNNRIVNVTFPTAKTVAGGEQFVFDFNLLKWTEDGAGIEPVIDDAPKTGLEDENRHFALEFKGTASDLTGAAPDQTFKLTTPQGFSFQVQTSADTALNYSDGSANPTLTAGAKVWVHGVFTSGSSAFKADSIRIKASGDAVAGAALSGGKIDTHETGSINFVMKVGFANGFTPAATTVNVVSTDTTQWFGFAGKSLTRDEFAERLNVAEKALVEGSYDATTNTLTALRIKLDGRRELERVNCEVVGAPSAGDATAGTFTLGRFEASGGNVNKDRSLTVSVTSETELVQANGTAFANATDFWAALATAPRVSVAGKVDPATRTLTAKRVRIHGSDNGLGFGVTLGGSASAFAEDGSFILTLRRWEDGAFKNGLDLTVKTDANTVYRLANGNEVTKTEFLAAFTAGSNLKVEGRFNSDKTVTAKKLRILAPEPRDKAEDKGDDDSQESSS